MKLKNIMKFKVCYKNYLSIILQIILKKKQASVVLKDGSKHIWEINRVWNLRGYVGSNFIEKSNLISCYDGKVSTLEFEYKDFDLRFLDAINNGAISDVFAHEEYSWLDPENGFVIDIGGNIGDTAIYFALNGAEHVIALEPYPYSYRTAVENIKLNNLAGKITFINAGYGKGEITIDEKYKNDGSSLLIQSNNGIKIPLFSLADIIKNYKIADKLLLLKMDCEGCEYNLLNEENDILRKFKRIEMEYHFGYENLKDKLESAGFIVKYTQPHGGKISDGKHIKAGYLYASTDNPQ